MEVKEMLSMNKGDGENSYAKCSRFTQQVAASAQPIIYRAVQSFLKEKLSSIKSVELLNVADLGCATGPNTFTVMSTVIESIVKICSELGTKIPEIQFYLNDLVGNDFNTLFKGLSVIQEKYKKDNISCFAMGAPGSFHARLFPANSIHLVHSSYGVHWLSKAPKITSEGGLPLNKGKIYISDTSPPQVRQVYQSQFQQDFISFLESRSPELVVDGRMVLIIHGRRSQDPEIESSYVWEILAEAISYLVSQGAIEEEKLDSFNVPYYIATQDEVKGLVEKEGSLTVEFMETFVLDLQGTWSTPELRAKSARAFTEPIISHHFGVDVMDKLYDKVAEIMVQRSKQGNEVNKGFPLVLELRKKKLKPQT